MHMYTQVLTYACLLPVVCVSSVYVLYLCDASMRVFYIYRTSLSELASLSVITSLTVL